MSSIVRKLDGRSPEAAREMSDSLKLYADREGKHFKSQVNALLSNLIGGLVEHPLPRADSREAPLLEIREALTPAVPVRKSITPEYLVCLEDGKKLKALRRHLREKYNMSPDEYRARWGLPPNYPMVAPRYAEKLKENAKKIGLGQRRIVF